jgi:hypothetical protein
VAFVVLARTAASHLFRGHVHEALIRHLVGATLAVTFVTVGELTAPWTLPLLVTVAPIRATPPQFRPLKCSPDPTV